MVMRQWWGTAIVAALLLTGCGGGAEADGASDKAAALSEDQVRDVLPDDEAMPGWKRSARPTAVKMNDLYRREACPNKGNAGCEDSRFFGASAFRHDDNAAYVSFLVIAYDSEEAAESAYRVLWDGHYGEKAGPSAKSLELGPLGDERDARFGTSGFNGEPGAVTQTRVGTTLLWTESASTGKGGIDEENVRELATVLADRSRQAQNGDAVSASLGG
ncbi:hypothetical protein OIE75_39860 [Streptomyces sp. NBC_01723]|uniref:hypothetical protein n=1 Tax=Streptomyces sp. NBC_01723 TaxID=2975921 RepID=UPI002E35445C|nr:hypothetical protein [Streptomyces sp. NBC_01723]